MTYTDEQLKQALAKMLPELLQVWDTLPNGMDLEWRVSSKEVFDTELLHLCRVVEETFSELYYDKKKYAYEIYKQHGFSSCVNCDGEDDWEEVFNYAHASWQQRVVALCKVMGVEIV